MFSFLALDLGSLNPSIGAIFLRLGLTAVFVGVIGFERQMRHKIAGVTTHLMVAFGACGIALLQEYLYYSGLDLAHELASEGIAFTIERQRIICQVIVGVGFLGSGTILKSSNGIYGLTTAATLWMGAMIGVCFGMGAYAIGIAMSLFGIFFLTVVRKLLDLTNVRHTQSPAMLGSEIVEK